MSEFKSELQLNPIIARDKYDDVFRIYLFGCIYHLIFAIRIKLL
jgi:hypothetical protein